MRDDIEVLISDRHGHDDAINKLAAEWGNDTRFRFLSGKDALNWVQHFNLLLSSATGEYFRWMPHDDLFPEGCLDPLIQHLDVHTDTLLAYAPTRYLAADGSRIPELDRLNSYPVEPGDHWALSHSLEIFERGSCDGAFKGLFRREPVVNAKLWIRPTQDLMHAERAWLFGLSLIGTIREVPDSIYLKRFHPGSVHAKWRERRRHVFDVTRVQCGYLRDYGPEPAYLRRRAQLMLWSRSIRNRFKPQRRE
jgi:hypothetical protein